MSYSDEQLEAAVEALSRARAASPRPRPWSPARRRACSGSSPRRSRRAAGSPRRTRQALTDALAVEDPAERDRALRTLLAEEARMGMMVGVAVGWALAEELRKPRRGGLRCRSSSSDTPPSSSPTATPTCSSTRSWRRTTRSRGRQRRRGRADPRTAHPRPLRPHGRRRRASPSARARQCIAVTELAGWLGEQGVENTVNPNIGGTVTTDWGSVKLVPAWHTNSRPRRHRDRPAERAHRPHRRQDDLPPRRHRAVQRPAPDRRAPPPRRRAGPDRRALHDGPRRRRPTPAA